MKEGEGHVKYYYVIIAIVLKTKLVLWCVFFVLWVFLFAVVPKNVMASVKKENCSIQVREPSVTLDWLFLSGQSHWTGALSASL